MLRGPMDIEVMVARLGAPEVHEAQSMGPEVTTLTDRIRELTVLEGIEDVTTEVGMTTPMTGTRGTLGHIRMGTNDPTQLR